MGKLKPITRSTITENEQEWVEFDLPDGGHWSEFVGDATDDALAAIRASYDQMEARPFFGDFLRATVRSLTVSAHAAA